MPRRIGSSVSELLAIVLVLGSGGCLGPVRDVYPPRPGEPTTTVYVRNNDWHTGFVVRAGDLPEHGRAAFRDFEGAGWLEIGWGNDSYYRSTKTNFAFKLAAAIIPWRGVLRIEPLATDPIAHYTGLDTDLYRLELSAAGYDRLIAFLVDSFDLDPQGQPVLVEHDGEGPARFYRATGIYCMVHTCNHWTADGLRAAGLPITPAYAAVAGNLKLQVLSRAGSSREEIFVLDRTATAPTVVEPN